MIAHHYGVHRNVFAEVDNESIVFISIAFWQNQVFLLVPTKNSFGILNPPALPLYRSPAIFGSKIFAVGVPFLLSRWLRKLTVLIFGQNFREHLSNETPDRH